MRQSNDTGHFFQTDSAISESKRKTKKSKNEAGDPIRLQSKLLAVIADPFNQGAVYVAEAAGTVKRIVLETKSTTHTLRPSTASASPFTSLATSQTHTTTTGTLFAGSWDKNIYAWAIDASCVPTTQTSRTTLRGHTDFVKALLCIPAATSTADALLVSASADKSIIVWNARTFHRLHTLTGHARGVQALALDPISLPDSLLGPDQSNGGVIVASGDSNREIRFWRISAEQAGEIGFKAAATGTEDEQDQHEQHKTTHDQRDEGDGEDGTDITPLVVHETSIFDLSYSSSGDLWTASADRTSKQLAPMRDFATDTTLTHNDYVKAVVVVDSIPTTAAAANDGAALVVTGCRDEHVRVWDGTSGNCIACLQGHWEEVTGLAMVSGGQAVVSVSIDGTIRRWGLKRQELDHAIEIYEQVELEKNAKKGVALTEDEERELAELMDDDDD